ncbi:MAG: hypothetical protein U1F10_16315 [Burkholderiales bacterium]
MNRSRRTFIAAGVAGAAALGLAAWLRGPHAPPSGVPRRALDADGEALFAAVIPVLLAGALPAAPPARTTAIAETLAGVDVAVSGLPPAAQAELAQLVALLALPPVRWSLARVGAPWQEASPAEVRAFLDRFRDSSLTLPRSAYDALHQLTFAAWYGNPRSWPPLAYDGPPQLG